MELKDLTWLYGLIGIVVWFAVVFVLIHFIIKYW